MINTISKMRNHISFDLVVTRHDGLVDFLIEEGVISKETPVATHIQDPEILDGKNVIGVLPVKLACRCLVFAELDLSAVPGELRGKELTVNQVRQYQGGLYVYTVNPLKEIKF